MNKLEDAVSKYKKSQEDISTALQKAESKRQADIEKYKRDKFRKEFKSFFGGLGDYVSYTFHKFSSNKVQFKYKGRDFYIAYEFWERQPLGIDDWYTSGYNWVLYPSHNGYNFGNEYTLNPEEGVDDIIKGLHEIESRQK